MGLGSEGQGIQPTIITIMKSDQSNNFGSALLALQFLFSANNLHRLLRMVTIPLLLNVFSVHGQSCQTVQKTLSGADVFLSQSVLGNGEILLQCSIAHPRLSGFDLHLAPMSGSCQPATRITSVQFPFQSLESSSATLAADGSIFLHGDFPSCSDFSGQPFVIEIILQSPDPSSCGNNSWVCIGGSIVMIENLD